MRSQFPRAVSWCNSRLHLKRVFAEIVASQTGLFHRLETIAWTAKLRNCEICETSDARARRKREKWDRSLASMKQRAMITEEGIYRIRWRALARVLFNRRPWRGNRHEF